MFPLYLDFYAEVRQAIHLEDRRIDDEPLEVGADLVGIRLHSQQFAEFVDGKGLDASIHVAAERQGFV